MATAAIILAGGQGRRMASGRAKVLHAVGGRSLLDWSASLVGELGCQKVAVVIPGQHRTVREAASLAFGDAALCVQDRALGTGDAVRAAVSALEGFSGTVVVLCADTPLVSADTASSAMRSGQRGLAVVGFAPPSPFGYGRLVMDGGYVRAIVEERDASDTERAIDLCNSGVIAGSWPKIEGWLRRLKPSAVSGEYYLTDVIALAVSDGVEPQLVMADRDEVCGVNTLCDLARVESAFQARARSGFLGSGVTLCAPETVFFSFDTQIGAGSVVEPYVVFGPGTVIGRNAHIGSFTHIGSARIGDGATVGPFARLRPGTDVGDLTRIGNFVEVKNARIGQDARIAHLSYVGDAEVGDRANLGAGTICCNFDGSAKHTTRIGEGAFIGSNSSLVAPVTVGDRAYVGSGSVIVEDVGKEALALARARQVEKPGRAARRRESGKSGSPGSQEPQG